MSNLRYLKLDQWMWNLNFPKESDRGYYESAYPFIGTSCKKDGIYCYNKGLCYIVVSGKAYQYDYESFMQRLRDLNAFERIGSTDDLEALAELELRYFGKMSPRVAERYQELLHHRAGRRVRKNFVGLRKRIKQWRKRNES